MWTAFFYTIKLYRIPLVAGNQEEKHSNFCTEAWCDVVVWYDHKDSRVFHDPRVFHMNFTSKHKVRVGEEQTTPSAENTKQ